MGGGHTWDPFVMSLEVSKLTNCLVSAWLKRPSSYLALHLSLTRTGSHIHLRSPCPACLRALNSMVAFTDGLSSSQTPAAGSDTLTHHVVVVREKSAPEYGRFNFFFLRDCGQEVIVGVACVCVTIVKAWVGLLVVVVVMVWVWLVVLLVLCVSW